MDVMDWAEKNPWLAGGIVFGGGLAVLWLLGFFSSGSSSNSGANNMAAAYYAAEAAQATAGTQLQMATVSATNQTAQVQAQANAAEAIATAQYGAATTINGQNASATTALGNDQLLASVNNSNNVAATTRFQITNTTLADYINSILAPEVAATGGLYTGSIAGLPGTTGNVTFAASPGGTGVPGSPNYYLNEGYSPADALALSRLQSQPPL